MKNKNWGYAKIGKKTIALLLLLLLPVMATPWSVSTSAGVDFALPAVVQNTVFFGQNDGKIIGLDYATGTQSLSILTAGGIYGNASLDGNNVYIGSTDGNLYSINAVTKEIRWMFSTKSNINGSAVVAVLNSVKYVFVASNDGYLYCLNESTGTELWSYNLKSSIWSAPVVHSGIVYVGAYDGNLYAIDATSTGSTNTPTLKWKYLTGEAIRGAAAISGDALYIGNDGGKLTAVDLATSSVSASVMWDYTGGGKINSAPVVDISGLHVYLNCADSYTYCVNTSNGTLNWNALSGIAGYGTPVIYGLNLVVDATDGYLKVMDRMVGWDENAQSINVGSMGNTPIVNNGEVIAKVQSGSIAKLSNTISSSGIPVVSTVSPSAGSYGQPSTISVTGSGFFGGGASSDVISVGLDDMASTMASSFTVVSDSSITGITLPGTVSVGTYNVIVSTTIGMNTTSAEKYSILAAPVVSGFSPMSGYTTQSVTLSVAGSGFFGGTATSAVSRVVLTGSTNVTVSHSNVTDTSLMAVVPSGISEGEYSIVVETSVCASEPSVSKYTAICIPPPSVTGVSPSRNARNILTTVNISGSGFYAGTEASAVTSVSFVGSTTVSLTGCIVSSDTQLSAVVPLNLDVGFYTVRVSTIGGTSTENVFYTIDCDDLNVLLLHLDGADNSTTITDASINDHNVTCKADAKLKTAVKKFGTASCYFDGTGDYLELPNSDSWNFGSGDFTIDFWIYKTLTGSSAMAVLGGLNDHWLSIGMNWYSNTRHVIFASSTGNSWDLLSGDGGGNGIGVNSVLTNDTWHHFALVRNGNQWMTFVDGIMDINTTRAGTLANPATTKSIGRWGGDATPKIKGYLDEFRITKGLARWTSNFDPLADREVLKLGMEGASGSTVITDSSAYPKYVTACGNTTISTVKSMYGGSSVYLDGGTSNYLAIQSSPDFYFGSEDFSIDCWFNIDNTTGHKTIFAGSSDWWLGAQVSGNMMCYYSSSNGTSWDLISDSNGGTGSITITPNTWHHFAYVRNGDIWTGYIDGHQDFTKTVSGALVSKSENKRIGLWGNSTYGYEGYIDEFRMTKGVRWTSDFDAFAACNVLLLHMDGEDNGTIFADSSTGSKEVTAVGDAKTKTNMYKAGSASGYFDGNGDYLSIPASTDFNIGAGDFTIDCWFYVPNVSAQKPIFASNTDLVYGFMINGNKMAYFASSNNSSWNILNGDSGSFNGAGTITITAEEWHHAAFVRSGNRWLGFVDGVIDMDETVAGTVVDINEAKCIGRWANYYNFTGYIDEFRFTKGIARWTSNFTPPSQGTETEIDISANNPGFELWNNGTTFTNPGSDYTYLADTWRTCWGGGALPCVVTRESSIKTEGNYSIRQTMASSGVSATSWGTFAQFAGYEAYRGQTIRLKADVYCSVADKASISMIPYNDRHTEVRSDYVTAANTWTTLSLDLYMPEDADDLQIFFGSNVAPANNEVYIADNFKLYTVGGEMLRMFSTETASVKTADLGMSLATSTASITANNALSKISNRDFAPDIKKITPSKVTLTSPVQVTISGANFLSGSKSSEEEDAIITVGLIPVKLSNMKVANTQISGTIDPGKIFEGVHELKITTSKGTSNPIPFTVQQKK